MINIFLQTYMTFQYSRSYSFAYEIVVIEYMNKKQSIKSSFMPLKMRTRLKMDLLISWYWNCLLNSSRGYKRDYNYQQLHVTISVKLGYIFLLFLTIVWKKKYCFVVAFSKLSFWNFHPFKGLLNPITRLLAFNQCVCVCYQFKWMYIYRAQWPNLVFWNYIMQECYLNLF